ncbi:reverse transcriptase domain-containing protein [Actibacterium sp. XHP0104]|uniref:reverse transcriptase domain-containing protein n=1 Tax=Actibacterium sp. XHP0104 TaxID=2984335 RepID=UPI0021E81C29|nr:reverse transcriptase domain-containing protein [Actibacterium sp. XHP0104]MCV2881269.1 reverse transcriptase domain-containing protein [Actibacterium sp. XHP0104]
MEKSYEYRFELKPGKHVFIPTREGMKRGQSIVSTLTKNWMPREFFYHFQKRGGHVAALRPHVDQQFKSSVDLTNFFPSVTRTKVHRSLKSIGYANRYALDVASESCVEFEGRKFLPYGFIQSMALATLVVEKSLLGQKISEIRASGGIVTMYVDDILVSGEDFNTVKKQYDEIVLAATESGFAVSEGKLSPPDTSVRAFNCELSNGEIRVLDARMGKFADDGLNSGDATKDAILRYVGVLNEEQRKFLNSIFF